MRNLSKQVVILDNISSPYIHQAIIILNSCPPGQYDRIIAEAEKVVAGYFNRKPPLEERKISVEKKCNALKGVVAALSVALAICSYLAFFK